jgi:DNA-binding transcriptional regulator YiaG
MKREGGAPMEKRKTIAEELIAGFTELADALEAGGNIGTKFNCYQMQLDLRPETYTPKMVKETREHLGASQAVFAKFLGVSVKSVSQWERGTGGRPSPIACRFMDEIRRNPDYYIARLRESMIPKHGKRKNRV